MAGKAYTRNKFSSLIDSEISQDFVVIAILLAVGVATIYIPVLNETPLRYFFTVPLLFFFPGYCLLALLFPAEGDLDLLGRVALSIGISIAIVAFIGLGLNYTPVGIQLDSVALIVTIFTMTTMLAAHIRGSLLSGKRFRSGFQETAKSLIGEVIPQSDDKIDRVLNITLALSIIVVLMTTAFVILLPNEGERFTEFYVLSEKMFTAGYPSSVIPGMNYSVYIGVGNQEKRNVTYTIETWDMDTKFNPYTNTTNIIASYLINTTTLTLATNETAIIPLNISINDSRFNRAEFLLFNETVPGPEITGGDRINSSYRELHLWMINQSAKKP